MTADKFRVYGSSEVERVKAKLAAYMERVMTRTRGDSRPRRLAITDDPYPVGAGCDRSCVWRLYRRESLHFQRFRQFSGRARLPSLL